jgi:hypothetical protein
VCVSGMQYIVVCVVMCVAMSNSCVCAVSIGTSYNIVSAKNCVCVLYVGGPIEDKLY